MHSIGRSLTERSVSRRQSSSHGSRRNSRQHSSQRSQSSRRDSQRSSRRSSSADDVAAESSWARRASSALGMGSILGPSPAAEGAAALGPPSPCPPPKPPPQKPPAGPLEAAFPDSTSVAGFLADEASLCSDTQHDIQHDAHLDAQHGAQHGARSDAQHADGPMHAALMNSASMRAFFDFSFAPAHQPAPAAAAAQAPAPAASQAHARAETSAHVAWAVGAAGGADDAEGKGLDAYRSIAARQIQATFRRYATHAKYELEVVERKKRLLGLSSPILIASLWCARVVGLAVASPSTQPPFHSAERTVPSAWLQVCGRRDGRRAPRVATAAVGRALELAAAAAAFARHHRPRLPWRPEATAQGGEPFPSRPVINRPQPTAWTPHTRAPCRALAP